MSTLITIACPDRFKAEAAIATLQDLGRQHLIALEDAVIAHHEGDKIKLEQVLNLLPAAGAAIGVLSGKLADDGIDDRFAKQMQAELGPDKVAPVVLVRSMAQDRVVAEMKKHQLGGEIVQTSLSEADEAKLRQAAAA